MGEVGQYHITMLVNSEQEDSIRKLFTDKNWTCWLNVVSDQTVVDVRQNGFDNIFTNIHETNDNDTDMPDFVEIKSEVVYEDYGTDTDSADEPSLYDVETPILPANDNEETKHEISAIDEDIFKKTKILKSNNEQAGGLKVSTPNTVLPIISVTPGISDLTSNALGTSVRPLLTPLSSGINLGLNQPMTAVSSLPTKGVPASGYISDFVEHNMLKPVKIRKTNQSYAKYSSAIKGIRKSAYLADLVTKIKNKGKISEGEDKLTNENEDESLITDKEENEKTKNKMYANQLSCSFCPDCQEKFSSLENLWVHRNEVKHTLPKTKPRGFAKRHYSPEELLKMGFLKCSECDYLFQDRRKLRQHMFANHREIMPNPVCPICGEEFEGYRDLYKHKREKQHMDSIWRLNSYQCETCGKHMTKYENFKSHKELSCGKNEEELKALHIHPCEICGKLFKTTKAAHQHKIKVHEQEESVCDICGKVLKTKFALRSHKRRHFDKNRKFVCKECGKGFFNVTILKQHERVHTKEKPFKCPMCEYTSSVAGNIKKHSCNIHKQNLAPIDLRQLDKSCS
ncbi:zinc finger protein 184-like [Ruditapes philippinarum]|uniref:zinc finger protein 184-like n=1 Tax=Ruditapes philippinarum TaxID=129788 RepID=UPI00295AAF18|nr:zinc finger protein 184-like [Ruditapes philippinarum]